MRHTWSRSTCTSLSSPADKKDTSRRSAEPSAAIVTGDSGFMETAWLFTYTGKDLKLAVSPKTLPGRRKPRNASRSQRTGNRRAGPERGKRESSKRSVESSRPPRECSSRQRECGKTPRECREPPGPIIAAFPHCRGSAGSVSTWKGRSVAPPALPSVPVHALTVRRA